MNKLTNEQNFIGFDKYSLSGAYHWGAIETNQEYVAQSNVIIKEIIEDKASFILDIGCGDGAIAGKLGRLLKSSKIFGFDAEPEAINLANKKLKEFNILNVKLYQSFIGSANKELENIIFDSVYSLDVIEHLPNPYELINFIKNLNPRSAIIGTPLFISEEFMSPYHVKEYTKEEILHLVGQKNIIKEWILPGNRKSKITGTKTNFLENYYICKLQGRYE